MNVIIDDHGSRSCLAWIKNLEKQNYSSFKKLRNDLDYLEMFGNQILKGGRKPKNIKPLTDADGLWEIRIDDYRVLFFYYDGNNIILTNGFAKKRKTTPLQEVEKALKIKDLYKK